MISVLTWLAVLIVCGTAIAADFPNPPTPDHSEVRIAVYDQSHLPPSVLETAGVEVRRIFRTGGIPISWINCSVRLELQEPCDIDPDDGQFLILRILPHGHTSTDLVFGQAFLGGDGFGRYADVYLDRLEQLHDVYGLNLSKLLGAIAAHELGHLLLGSGAHSVSGIMTPIWDGNQLGHVEAGALVFLPQQSHQIRRRIEVLKRRESTAAIASSWEAK